MNTKTNTQIRYEILHTVDAMTKQYGPGSHNVYPAQIDNSTYTELGVQLQILADKKLLNFSPKALRRIYEIELLPAGAEVVRDFYLAFQEKDDGKMSEIFTLLK